MMAFPASLVLFFFVSRMLFIFHLVEGEDICLKEFECGKLGNISYPFTDHNKPSCGLLLVNCQRPDPQIKLWVEEDSPVDWPEIANLSPEEMQIEVPKSCYVFQDLPLPEDENTTFNVTSTLTPMVKCTDLSLSASEISGFIPNYGTFNDCIAKHRFIIYYNQSDDIISAYSGELPPSCSTIYLALENTNIHRGLYDNFAKEIAVEWKFSKPWHCDECFDGGHQCIVTQDRDSHNIYTCSDNGSAIPAKHDADVKGKRKKIALLVLGLVICGIVVSIIICTYLFIKREKKKNKDGSYLLSRNMSYEPSSKAYIEDGSVRFEVPVYTYDELEKATASFNSANELGDGGFGIVYFGKLKDGREVAVKRLYEHNYRRMEQFENEINILTSLRHPNLVSLYGCTSRHSRELLLVYEFVPNGTIADHIHGNKAESKLLTWPIRMNIAVETSNALAYLHKSDIIHRDVKTNNILLDHNFSVKVADFGLSRLFPLNVTHISTAPQGTPGYVDPDYHECYQLTNKSDVYSFGVVLIELISSLPAVDISRHRHEINLSNLAISKIQSNALDELIDSSLGYGSDPEVTRMTRLIAELAFRCLQVDKEMRPSMDEVVEILEAIKQGTVSSEPREVSEVIDKSDVEKGVRIHPSPESDGVVLLKNRKMPSSPMSVTEDWVSGSSLASV